MSVAGVHYEAPVWQHLRDEPHHVSIRDDPKQFQVESNVPHGVISSCQVHKHYPSFLVVLKAVFDVLCLLVVLPGPRLIYHGGSRLVPEEAVDPPCTGSMRLSINSSRILNGTQISEMGLFDLGSFAGLFRFGRATTVARRQVFGSLNLRKHDVKNEHRHACMQLSLRFGNDELWVDVVASWCFTLLQLFDGRFKLFYCKVTRLVGVGGGYSRKRGDFTRRPACQV